MTSRFKQGRKAEQRLAEKIGGRCQPGSGNQWFAKGDVQTATHLIQVKATKAKSYTVTLKELEEIERQAAAVDKEPSFVIEFTTPSGVRKYKIERMW